MMTKNVGTLERFIRTFVALPLAASAVLAPMPLPARLVLFAVPAVVLVWTALSGACLVNKMLGRNTCALPR